MKRLLMASALLAMLCAQGIAGDIPTDGAPKPQSQGTTSPTLLGDIPSDGRAESLSDAALSALLTALGLASF
jgi:hypothetical protein